MEWLLARVPGLANLPAEDIAAILSFTFLWSLFEAKVMACNATADTISAKVDQWRDAGTLDAEQYGAELAYFRARYFENGAFTDRFSGLKLKPSNQPAVVQSVLDATNNDARDRLFTTLMIVLRFRNNLFHGEKWAYEIQDQRPNFIHANSVLMRLLDRHWPLGV
jgi:hypothetical protein